MNFKFEVGDIVRWNLLSEDLELVKEFVSGIFHAKSSTGNLYRVRSKDLVRVRRPSDEVARVEVAKRKEEKAFDLKVRRERVERNREEFSYLSEYKIRLTADGLPDKRCKPKYNAKNSPVQIKRRPRGGLL